MARHILMYRGQRQRWLARKIASRQPLVARIAHRQRLLQELIPTAGTPAPSDPFNARFRRTGDPSWSPVEPLSTQQDTTEPAPPTIVVSDDTLRTGVIHHALAHPVEQPAGRDESRPYEGPPDLNVHVHHRAPVPPASPLPQAKPSPTLQDMQAPAPRATVVPDDTPRRGPIHRAPSPLQQDEGRSTAEFQRHDPLGHQGRDESRPYEVSSPPISIGPGAHGSEPAEAQDHIRLPELSIPESIAASEPLLEQPLPESTAISEPLREQFILESIAASEPVPEQPVMENREASEPLVAQPSMVSIPAGEPTPAAPSAPLAEAVQPPETNISVEPERQQEQKRVDEPAQEGVKPRRSRGRIMEQPAEPVSTAHTEAVPPSPPTRASHRKTPEEAAHKAVDDLFLPRDDTDRSPQAWLARLSRAAGARGDNTMLPSAPEETGQREIPPVGPGQPPAGREQPLAQPLAQSLAQPLPRNAVSGQASGEQSVRPAPAPLSQRARRLLRPLVGIDPTSINVYRDPQGEQLADTYQADAVTVGDEVILAAGHPDDAPETLGLLAHEFTHVARRREPRFVPPIARAPGSSSSRIIRPPVMGETGPGNGLERVATSSAPTDEEQLARRVERRVTRAAQETVSFPDAATGSPVESPAAMETSRAVSLPRSEGDIWGGLPAPWEPLPDWLVAPPVTTGGSTQPAVVYSQASPIVSSTGEGNGIYAGGANVWSGDAGIPGVQRAGTERSLSEEQEQTEQQDAPHAPEPDLDLLARQVYALLKRRLGVEHRRER